MLLSKNSFIKFICASILLISFLSLEAQVTIIKTAGDYKNPGLIFKGVSGNLNVSLMVSSNLNKCGWFDIKNSGSADYVISGTFSEGNTCVLNVSGVKSFSVSEVIDSSDIRKSVHKLVDKLLNRIFAISGLCSSKIAFCLEVTPGKKEIYICDFDGGDIERVTRYGSLCVEPDWFPNNLSIVYTMYQNSYTDIIETELTTRRSRRLAQFPGLNSGGAVSPNGKYLAMILSRDKKVELYIKTIGNRSMKRLTNGSAVEASPCWSPRGGSIAYVSDSSGRPDLYMIELSDMKVNKLPTIGSEAVSPDWSDSNRIVYSAKMGKNYTIAVLDLAGKSPGSVISVAGDWESPSWAPDNRHVVCSRRYNNHRSLYIIDTWTGKIRPLLSLKYNLSMPSWSGIFK